LFTHLNFFAKNFGGLIKQQEKGVLRIVASFLLKQREKFFSRHPSAPHIIAYNKNRHRLISGNYQRSWAACFSEHQVIARHSYYTKAVLFKDTHQLSPRQWFQALGHKILKGQGVAFNANKLGRFPL